MNFLRQNEASWNYYRRKLMNITQDLNSISVCMTVDEFSKQKKKVIALLNAFPRRV